MSGDRSATGRRRRNWRRGFFRLWIVVSVLWIIVVVLLFQPWATVSEIRTISANVPPAIGPDIVRIKQNVMRMVNASSSEADIDAYIATEGVTVADVRGYSLKPWEKYAATGAVVTAAQAEALRQARLRASRNDLTFFALRSGLDQFRSTR